MKKIKFIILIILLMTVSPAYAKNYKVLFEATQSFSTLSPSNQLILRATKTQTVDEHIIPQGTIIKCNVVEVAEAKRGKQNGYAKLSIVEAAKSDNETLFVLKNPIKVKAIPYSETDYAGLATSAGTSVVSHWVPGFSQGVGAIKGMVQAKENESLLKAAAKGVYETTPLTYASKGKELIVNPNDKITIIFTVKKADKVNNTKE